ncbi:glycosyltransferase WbuB [Marinococcus halophilus]|uniref:Glycosyltransferase WbuB n=1 Tax=Marinococcus halophilus TaxID=1371 RepID=A0A510Y320_MARHA|nr:glycosyltransferase family 4 protein [Marinococcus halophilus]OZT81753.1 glycosyltransferase WbuB [Marinococcus halophilus]GEK57712.1 glycosyltransferase WbuB [Marinococcus halophilus]
MKKLVFVINYFYPDLASTGQLMTELCEELADDFAITVIAAQPGYAGTEAEETTPPASGYHGSIKVVRVPLPPVNKNSKVSRAKYVALYFTRALHALQKEKNVDLVYTISQPPVLGGLLGTIGKVIKRARHVYNIQDFNPEQAEAAGYVKNQTVLRLAKAVDTVNCALADHVVVVGEDMRTTLRRRFGKRRVPMHSVINNWTNEKTIVPLDKTNPEVQKFLHAHGLENKFIVMYSGNLGLYYDLENLIRLTEKFQSYPDVRFVFIGEGAKKAEIQEFVTKHDLANVLFLPYQPLEFIKYSLNAADVHLVVNQKGIKGVSVPSKIYGVMAAGKPAIGVLEAGSEAEKLLRVSCSGLLAEPKDYAAVEEAITAMYHMDAADRQAMGRAGRAYLDQHLTREVSIGKYRTLFEDLTREKHSAVVSGTKAKPS